MTMSRTLNLVLCGLAMSAQMIICPQVGFSQLGGRGQSVLASGLVAAEEPGVVAAKEQGDSLLLREPSDPEAMFDTVVLMVDLAKLDSAKKYLDKLMAAKPKDAAILKMREKHGTTVFLQLSNMPELQPQSIQLLERMNAAFHKAATNPKRLDGLIDELTESPSQREAAIIQLRSVGSLAVGRLMRRIADPKKASDRSSYVAALVRLGGQAVPPLLGALEAPDPDVKSAALDGLGQLGTARVCPYLWFPAFDAGQTPDVRRSARHALARILYGDSTRVDKVSAFGAVDELLRIAHQHFRNEYEWTIEDDGKVITWFWDSKQSSVVPKRMPPEDASLIAGTRFVREALSLAPENREAQALFLAIRLAADVQRVGWDQSLPTGPGTTHDLALVCGEEIVAECLEVALDNPNPASALASLQVLGQIGTVRQLHHSGSRSAPLIQALNYPDMRVRFAAATAILQIDPQTAFPNSPRVVSVLQRALNDSGRMKAVTIDPDPQRSTTVAGIVADIGYEPLVAKSGREGFKMASERGDVELILIHENAVQWELSMTLANLRADARTTGIPIAIYGPDPREPRIQHLLHQYPLIGYVVETISSGDLKGQLTPFLQKLRTPAPTAQQRRARVEAAVFWFAHIANGKRTEVFDITPAESALVRAATAPDLAVNALFALGSIATATSQRELLNVAANKQLKPGIRETAALQLAFHIQRFGLLLSGTDVNALRSAWNGEGDTQVKTALASAIGSLEPEPTEVGRRLLEFPTAPDEAPVK